MTRINCIPPNELTDKHLLAEYRELPRVFRLSARWRYYEPPALPTKYTLGKGHVKFFYDKLKYCINRQHEIVREMKARGFNPKFNPEDLWHFHEKAGGTIPERHWKDWSPGTLAQRQNRQRIKERLNEARIRNSTRNHI